MLSFTLLSSCKERVQTSNESTLISIQVIDRNGFAETVSAKDRLSRYKNVDFCDPQPYQKVLRVFGKNNLGQSTSRITSYHSNGHIWQYLEIVDGRAHGTYKEWHLNGRQKMQLEIIEGSAELSQEAFSSWVFEGKNLVWDDQSNLVAEIFYEKGMLHGESLYYYPEGQIKKRIPYFQDKIQGSIIFYAADGTILETISYLNDEPHGKAFACNQQGGVIYEELFENGLLMKGLYYGPNGEELTSISDGSGCRTEFEDGVLKRFVQYVNGFPDGLVECLDSKGFVHISYNQKDGKKQGEEKEFYPKKSIEDPYKIKILLNWQTDVLQGPVKTWFINGSQESQKEMYQNKKNGLCFAWYKNGDLLLSEEYENDILSSGSYYKKGDKKPVSRIIVGKGTATIYDPDGYFLKKIPYEKGIPLIETPNPK